MKDNLIEWSDKYSVQIDEIDNQHKQLVDIINKLYRFFKAGNVKDKIHPILDELIDYTHYHFQTEERYFRVFNYSDAKRHVVEHQIFTKKVSDFLKDFEAKKLTVSYDVMLFLKDWLLKHILISDKEYISCFKEKGL